MSGPEPGTGWDTYASGSGRHWLEDVVPRPWDYDITWDYDKVLDTLQVLDTLHGGEDLNIEAPGAAVLPVLRPPCCVPDGQSSGVCSGSSTSG